MKKKAFDFSVIFIFLSSFLIKLIYIINTSVFERGHDVGAYTDIGDGLINPGHLGYIEYIVKFGRLPQINPFDLFSYYHPPLHHLLAAVVVKLSLVLGATTERAFENIQLLTLLYTMLTLWFAYRIFCEIGKKDKCLLFALILLAYHPSFVYMSGSVNNDALTVLFETLCIYFTIKWMKKYEFKYLILMAFSIGLGMCTKISVVIMAFPMGLVMLVWLLKCIKNQKAFLAIKEYMVFAFISLGLGLSWTVRNLIKFGQKPGIASATPEDIKYMGNISLLERLGIPLDLGLDYPFHNIYGSESRNVWLIMFRTALFSEMRPDVSGVYLAALRIAFIFSLFLGLSLAAWTIIINIRYIMHKGEKGLMGVFILSSYIIVVMTYIAFVIKYPYTCSCDFRYIVPALLFAGISLCQITGINKS